MSVKVHRTIEMYKDMLTMPRHISTKRAHMAVRDRAAQFAPFSAVVGHEKAVLEATRYTENKRELDEMEKAIINEKLHEIDASLPASSEVEIVYFKPDEHKSGGAYTTVFGKVNKINTYDHEVQMLDGTIIPITAIYAIEF